MKVDYRPNGYMLYFKDDQFMHNYRFCNINRYKVHAQGRDNAKDVYVKKIHYMSLIVRLKRL